MAFRVERWSYLEDIERVLSTNYPFSPFSRYDYLVLLGALMAFPTHNHDWGVLGQKWRGLYSRLTAFQAVIKLHDDEADRVIPHWSCFPVWATLFSMHCIRGKETILALFLLCTEGCRPL